MQNSGTIYALNGFFEGATVRGGVLMRTQRNTWTPEVKYEST